MHSKPQESRNESCGVETHGNRPDLVKSLCCELLCVGVEQGGIPYILVLIARKAHVAPNKCSRPSDADPIEWQSACTHL